MKRDDGLFFNVRGQPCRWETRRPSGLYVRMEWTLSFSQTENRSVSPGLEVNDYNCQQQSKSGPQSTGPWIQCSDFWVHIKKCTLANAGEVWSYRASDDSYSHCIDSLGVLLHNILLGLNLPNLGAVFYFNYSGTLTNLRFSSHIDSPALPKSRRSIVWLARVENRLSLLNSISVIFHWPS